MVDPKDFLQPPASAIAPRVLSQAKPGAIVLMHDGGASRHNTVQALSVIPQLKQQGYRFVTVPQNASCTKAANCRSQIPLNRHLNKIDLI
jgi:peptidoglycan/xylan/chitin deacetylase (PgdA/CDA1 family)